MRGPRFKISSAEWAAAYLDALEVEMDRPIKIIEIAEQLGHNPTTVGGKLTELVNAGLVDRVERKTSGLTPGYKPHALGYRITPKGKAALSVFRKELAAFLAVGETKEDPTP